MTQDKNNKPTIDAIREEQERLLPLLKINSMTSGSDSSGMNNIEPTALKQDLDKKLNGHTIFISKSREGGWLIKELVKKNLNDCNTTQFAKLKYLFDALLNGDKVLVGGIDGIDEFGKDIFEITTIGAQGNFEFSVPTFAELAFIITLSDCHHILFDDFYTELFPEVVNQ